MVKDPTIVQVSHVVASFITDTTRIPREAQARMDSSMVESVFDDHSVESDTFSPPAAAVRLHPLHTTSWSRPASFLKADHCVLQKPKAKAASKTASKAAPKTTAKKAATTTKSVPKKMLQTTLKEKSRPTTSKKRAKPLSEDEGSDSHHDQVNDESLLSNTPPSAKKQKKGPTLKKTGGKPLQPIENETMALDGASDKKPKKASSSTEQYQKVYL